MFCISNDILKLLLGWLLGRRDCYIIAAPVNSLSEQLFYCIQAISPSEMAQGNGMKGQLKCISE